ncbi:MAG: hypothetical protein AAB444_02860 [Patescibacteria group bacterium]
MSKVKNVFERAGLAVVGAMSLTKTRKREIIKELIEEGKMSKTEAAEFVEKTAAKIEGGKNEIIAAVEKAVKGVLKELDIPTRSELMKIKKDMEKWARRK